MKPLDCREWLEAEYRQGGPKATWAAEALDALDAHPARDALGDAVAEMLSAAGLIAVDATDEQILGVLRMFLPC